MRRTGLSFQRGFWPAALGHASTGWMRVSAVGLALAGMMALVAVGMQWLELERQQDAVHVLLAEARARQAAVSGEPAPKPRAPRYSAQQLMQFNAVIRQLNTPWSEVLDALERQTPPGVALILVEPDANKRIVHVQAEAKEVDALFAYVDLLAADVAFSGAVPLQHETNEQDPTRPARLGFDLQLKPSSGFARRQP